MNTEQEIKDFIVKYAGHYQFKSPYHKSKKMLPFNIIGRSYNADYPISVYTVEYKGWARQDDYKIEVLKEFIETGFIIKEA
jgi:hypothetical protein